MPAKSAAAVEEQETTLERPARTSREGRTIQPKNLGKMTVYTFKDVVDFAYTQGFRRFDEPIAWESQSVSQSGKPMTTVYVKIPAIFLEQNPNTGMWEEVKHWGFGDANYENCGGMVAPHYPRMADTRARGRALAHALNLDANFAEEMGDSDSDAPRPSNKPAVTSRPGTGIGEADYPPPNGPNGTWVCVVTGDEVTGKNAYWSMRKHGEILSWDEQQKRK